MNKTYKFRIYPNQAQAILINKKIVCSRYLFN
ncbi:helix-turn-helix domain-containing protein, partial [Bacillus thuringiensis]|nr:helix-turn-helix domain-containing protein [Bacillus thuringiensis]